MLFENTPRRLPFLLLVICVSNSSHAAYGERVLSETSFDEDGVRSITYTGQENTPSSDNKETDEGVTVAPLESRSYVPGEPGTDGSKTADNPPASAPSLFRFLSNIFRSTSEASADNGAQESAGIIIGQDSATATLPRGLGSPEKTQQRLDAIFSSESDPPSSPTFDSIELSSGENGSVDAGAGHADTTDTTNGAVPGDSADQRPQIEVGADGPGSELESKPEPREPALLQIQLPDKSEDKRPTVFDRVIGFFKKLDPSTRANESGEPVSDQESWSKIAEPQGADNADLKRDPIEIPKIVGEPDAPLSQPSDPVEEIIVQNRSVTESVTEEAVTAKPTNPADLRDKFPFFEGPVIPRSMVEDRTDGDVLNPMMIGRKLDLFAVNLIGTIRQPRGREPFQKFALQISQVFFSTPTVLRLIELEKTINTQVAEAEALAKPQVSLSVEEGRRIIYDGSDGRLASQTVTATQSVFDFGIIQSGIDQSKNNVSRTLAEIRQSRSEALLDLILAYNELSTAQENMELVEVFSETRVQFLDLVDQKLKLGVSSRADLVRAEAKAYEAQGELPVARKRLQSAEDRFVELFGISPPKRAARYDLPEDPINLAELGVLIDQHPAVRAVDLEYQNAQLNLQRISSERKGAINFQVTGSRSDTPTTSSTDQFDGKLVYQVDLYDGGDLSARLERASGAVLEARWELERVRRETRRIIEGVYSDLVANQSLELARLNSLEATIKASDATKELFMYDRGDLTDIFRVQDDYLNAAKALVEARSSSYGALFSSFHAADLLIDKFGLGI